VIPSIREKNNGRSATISDLPSFQLDVVSTSSLWVSSAWRITPPLELIIREVFQMIASGFDFS
jgi:hypothetical protein